MLGRNVGGGVPEGRGDKMAEVAKKLDLTDAGFDKGMNFVSISVPTAKQIGVDSILRLKCNAQSLYLS